MSDQLPDALNRVATAALTIAGLVILPIQIAQQTGSTKAGILSAIFLSVLLGVPAAYHLIPGPVQRRFGVRRYRSPVVLVDSFERVTVDSEYRATIDTTSSLIFLEEPTIDDLVDVLDVLPHETVEETAYTSTDSRTVDVIRRSPSTLAVRWQPRSPIRPYIPCIWLPGQLTEALAG